MKGPNKWKGPTAKDYQEVSELQYAISRGWVAKPEDRLRQQLADLLQKWASRGVGKSTEVAADDSEI